MNIEINNSEALSLTNSINSWDQERTSEQLQAFIARRHSALGDLAF